MTDQLLLAHPFRHDQLAEALSRRRARIEVKLPLVLGKAVVGVQGDRKPHFHRPLHRRKGHRKLVKLAYPTATDTADVDLVARDGLLATAKAYRESGVFQLPYTVAGGENSAIQALAGLKIRFSAKIC